MPRIRLAILLIVPLALSLHAGGARADDDPAPGKSAPPKAVELAAAVAKWPAPSKSTAYSFEGAALLGKARVGTFTLGFAPREVEGAVVGWTVTRQLLLSMGATKAKGVEAQHISAALAPQGGAASENFEATKQVRWSAKEGKIHLEAAEEGKEKVTQAVAYEGPLLPGMAGLIMCARFLPAERATYRGNSFSSTDDEKVIAPFVLHVDPGAKLDGVVVMALRGQRLNDRIEIVVHPKTRDVLRMRLTKVNDPMVMTIIPTAAAGKPAGDIFERAPQTAEEAAVHALYALTAKNEARIEKAFRWSSMYEEARKAQEAAGKTGMPAFDVWKADVLKGMMQRPAGWKPIEDGQLRVGLTAVMERVRILQNNAGQPSALFPKDFGRLLVVLEKKDDGWKAIGVQKLGP